MIELLCPSCGHQLRIPDKYGGKKGRCKYCKERFMVPPAPTVEMEAAEPAVGVPGLGDDSGGFGFEDVMADSTGMEDVGEPEVGVPGLGGDSGSANFEEMMGEGGAHVADPMGIGTPPPVDYERPDLPQAVNPLGCMYWGFAFMFPPVGLIWGLFVPSDHPEKIKGVVTSVVMLTIAAIVFGLSFMLTQNANFESVNMSAGLMGDDGATGDGGFLISGGGVSIGGSEPMSNGLPGYRGLVYGPAEVIPIEDGAMMNLDPGSIAFVGGEASGDYFDIVNALDQSLRSGGWEISTTGGFDSTRGRYSLLAAELGSNSIYVEIVETETGGSVTVARPAGSY